MGEYISKGLTHADRALVIDGNNADALELRGNLKYWSWLMGLEPGKRYRFPLFNPGTMSTEDAFVTVEGKETIKVGDGSQTVYKLKESFQGMEAFSWITQQGETIKQESPLGYSLLKETRIEALKRDKRGPVVDITSLVKIPSSAIANSGDVKMMRLRLSAAPLTGFDLDGGRQSWKDGVMEVRTLEGTGSYQIPYTGKDRAADLEATMLVQSDDKQIREQAARIVGREQDGRCCCPQGCSGPSRHPPAAPGEPTTAVNIVSPVPVPVTVTTPISGTVEISGTPTVQIAEPVKTPFWGHDGETIPLNYVSYSINLGAIPAGQRLVIEHVSLRCLGDSDDSFPDVGIWVFEKKEAGYYGYGVPLFARQQGTTYDGKSSWVVSERVQLYSGGGSGNSMTVWVAHSKTTATASCYAHVSGYKVATP